VLNIFSPLNPNDNEADELGERGVAVNAKFKFRLLFATLTFNDGLFRVNTDRIDGACRNCFVKFVNNARAKSNAEAPARDKYFVLRITTSKFVNGRALSVFW